MHKTFQQQQHANACYCLPSEMHYQKIKKQNWQQSSVTITILHITTLH